MLGHILVDGVIREASQRVNAEIDLDFRFVSVTQLQQTLRKILHLRNGEPPGLVIFGGGFALGA